MDLVVLPSISSDLWSRLTCAGARLAQMVERMTLNHVVAGSIPAVGVKQKLNFTFCSDPVKS